MNVPVFIDIPVPHQVGVKVIHSLHELFEYFALGNNQFSITPYCSLVAHRSRRKFMSTSRLDRSRSRV